MAHPPYKVKLKVKSPSFILVDGQPKQETDWIEGTHAFQANLTGVAAGAAPASSGTGGEAAPTAAGSCTAQVTCTVSPGNVDGDVVPKIVVSIE